MNPGFQVGTLVWVGLLITRDPSLAHLAVPSRFLGPSNLHSPQCGAFCHPLPMDPSRSSALPPHYETKCTGFQNPIRSKPLTCITEFYPVR